MKDDSDDDIDEDDGNDEEPFSIGQAMVNFARPLLDSCDQSKESIEKAMSIASLCWTLALSEHEKDNMVEEMIDKSQKEDKLNTEDVEAVRAVVKMMIERHKRMFPELHRKAEMKFGHGKKSSKRKTTRKDFVTCPVCKITIKASNLEQHNEKVHSRPRIPHAGTLWRFSNTHRAEMMKAMEDEYARFKEGKSILPREKIANIKGDDYPKYRAIAKAEGYRVAIRKIAAEKEQRLVKGENESEVSEWAVGLYFDMFYDAIPGFEDFMFSQFYTKERCDKCTVDDKEESQCEVGGTDCIYDDEWKQFEREYLDRAVDKILNGEDEPDELRIPDDIRQKAIETNEFTRQWRKKMGVTDEQ
jgi:hypothetical protein